MPRGGSRKHPADCQCGHCPKLGRKKGSTKADLTADGNKDFATRVLARVGEKDWLLYADVRNVKSDEDYALHLLAEHSLRGGTSDQFHRLLDRKFGRAIQQIRVANPEGKKFQVEHSIDVEGLREKLLAALGG